MRAAAAVKRGANGLQALPSRAALFAHVAGKPEAVLAKVIVEGDPVDMAMPSEAALAPTRPYADIRPDELNGAPQSVTFNIANAVCDDVGKCVTGCDPKVTPACALRFMVDSYTYSSNSPPRVLALNTAARWTLGTDNGAHPFHVHVNAFQVYRTEPDGLKHSVWKDTWLVDPDDGKTVILTRYEDFDGDFVLHCHILDHEDQGMMQRVSIRKP
ncbi:MAG: multicopper oxidase domain-containing protein [Sphingomonas sp.]